MDRLEALAYVSQLIPWPPPGGTAVAAETGRIEPAATRAPDVSRAAATRRFDFRIAAAPSLQETTRSEGSFRRTREVSTATQTAPPASDEFQFPTASDEANRFAGFTILAAPSSSSSAGASQAVGGAASSATPAPSSTPVDQATPSANAPASNAAAPANALPTAGGLIRPLTMAPPSVAGAASSAPAAMHVMDGSGGGDGPTMAETYGAPTIGMVSGGGDDAIIGGLASAMVSAPGGMAIMKSVEWNVDGAMESQDYRNIVGTTTPLAAPVTHGWLGGSVQSDGFSFYWDATPGMNHTVSATVTYSDDSTATTPTITVNVLQPTVNDFTVSRGEVTMTEAYGFTNGAFGMNINVNATVSLPAGTSLTGDFSIIDLIDKNKQVEILVNGGPPQGQDATHTLSTDLVLRDNGGGDNAPGYLLNNLSIGLPPGLGANGSGDWNDATMITVGTTKTANSEPIAYSGGTETDVYLVFRPTGGIWVQLAKVSAPVELSGHMARAIGTNDFVQVGQFVPANADANPLATIGSTGFVSWTNYQTKALASGAYSPPLP